MVAALNRGGLGLALCSAAWSSSCGPPTEPPTTTPDPPPACAPYSDTGAQSIAIAAGSRQVSPGVPHTVSAQVTPADRTRPVRFALTDTDRVFLESALVETDADGVATTTLYAQGNASDTFALHAAVDCLWARAASFQIVGAPRATLFVTPIAPVSSRRVVDTWVVSAHPGLSCSDFEGNPPPDGDPRTEDDNRPGRPIELREVPAGINLAVTVRAEQFAGGCRNVFGLNANVDAYMDVDIVNRPMQLAGATLELAFSLDEETAFDTLFDELVFESAGSLIEGVTGGPEGALDLDAVLDAMQSSSQDAAAFAQARTERDWRSAVLADSQMTLVGAGLRDLTRQWMQTGLSRLTSPGALTARLTAPELPDETAELELLSMDEQLPSQLGFSAESLASFVSEPNDFLRIGLAMQWAPAPLLQDSAESAALAQFPEVQSLPEAMASAFGCGQMASTLVAASPDPNQGEAFPSCDVDCAEGLCRDAMVVLWQRVAVHPLESVQWSFTGAAQADVGSDAQPLALRGSSVNGIVRGATELSIPGTFEGRAAGD